MRAIKGLAAILALLIPSQVLAKADWVYVADATLEADAGKYVVQIDKASIRRNGSNTLYWLRIADSKNFTWSKSGIVFHIPKGPSLYEDNCTAPRFRVVQGQVILGYEGPSIPLSRPAEWQFIAPDSLAEKVHAFVCSANGTK